MSDMPTLALPPKPQFMVLDGKTYLMDKIEQSPEDMLRFVEAYYKDSLEVLKERVSNHCSAEGLDDLNQQVLRIERHLASGVVTIPEGLRGNGNVFYLRGNKIYEGKVLLYKPSRISCTLQHANQIVAWINSISRRDAERFTKFVEYVTPIIAHYVGLNRDTSAVKMDFIVDQDIVVEATVAAYLVEENLIGVSPHHFHAHVFTDGHLCTGQASARVFWDDAQFLSNFNSLNPHSFANNSTSSASSYRNMLKNQYFVEGRVRTEEVSAWRV